MTRRIWVNIGPDIISCPWSSKSLALYHAREDEKTVEFVEVEAPPLTRMKQIQDGLSLLRAYADSGTKVEGSMTVSHVRWLRDPDKQALKDLDWYYDEAADSWSR